ncbi:MAG: phytoene/squalene synthase family protein [Gammaproteobacteria bacterium]
MQDQHSQRLDDGLRYQDQILPGVSRTFALTIPQLPPGLREIVTNAYLLCRIADTVEDEAALSVEQKQQFHQRFLDVLDGNEDGKRFSADLYPLLSDKTIPDEKELIHNADTIVRVTLSATIRQRAALRRCVATMCHCMPRFQQRSGLGLEDLREMDHYCYCVAGCVGEMLTELFCGHSDEIAKKHDALHRLSASFGQGLQMTNILKDTWDDLQHGFCWLPRQVFAEHGYDLHHLAPDTDRDNFVEGLEELIGVAHSHLRNALDYTLMIPAHETGIRRFCLWAIGLAILTLQRIHANPGYTSGQEIKVSRRTLKQVIVLSNTFARSNTMLRLLFFYAARGLPLTQISDTYFESVQEVN